MLMYECCKCRAPIKAEGMCKVVMVTLEKFTESRRMVDRRYLCFDCHEELEGWLENKEIEYDEEKDLPMGG